MIYSIYIILIRLNLGILKGSITVAVYILEHNVVRVGDLRA